jgi:hypothetical protein
MKKEVLLSADRKNFITVINDGNKITVNSPTKPFTVPLNRRERVQKMAESLPGHDRNIEIGPQSISIQTFEVDVNIDGIINLEYKVDKKNKDDDYEIIAVWEKREPIELFNDLITQEKTFESKKMKVFTIPLKEGVVVIATSNKWTCAHFPCHNGLVGEVIPEISKGSYMMKCRPELLMMRDILPELEFKIRIQDIETIRCNKIREVSPEKGYFTVIKDQRCVKAFMTHSYLP